MNSNIKVPAGMLLNPIHFLSLGFGSGLTPRMPGTAGSAVGIGLFVLLPELHWRAYLGLVLLALLAGIFLCAITAAALKVHDHPAIVWDEVVGVFIALFMVPREGLWLLLGFVLFRTFDVLKPWPISWMDKHVKGGYGIMLDDVAAGLCALFIIQILLYLL